MAKKKPASAEDAPAPGLPAINESKEVRVLVGHDADGGIVSGVSAVDLEDGQSLDPAKGLPSDVHIGGEPYVHIADASDGSWIYAHRDVRKR